MAREDHFFGCTYNAAAGGGGTGGSGGSGGSDGGGGGSGNGNASARLSKKVKQKKVPQRGLGVAQLEKIRLEEQQKMDSLEAPSVLGNSVNSSSEIAPFLPVNCPKFRPPSLPSLYNPLPSAPSNLPSPNALYRQTSSVSVPNLMRSENPVQLSNSNGGGDTELRRVSSLGHGMWPRLLNGGEYSFMGEKQLLDHQGLGCSEGQTPLPYEMNTVPVLTHPIGSQRSSPHQFPQPSSPLMVNVSPGISRSPGLQLQIEPPSNQSSRSDNHTPLWPDDDKIVGMKRPYPFALESSQAPNLHCNLYPGPMSQPDDIASSSNGYRSHMEPRNKCIREDTPSSIAEPKWNNKLAGEKGGLSGDFLTLAPPALSSPSLDTKQKGSLCCLGNERHKLLKFESMSGQESLKGKIYQPGPSRSSGQPFNFFPIRYDQTTSCVSNDNAERGETAIDLNLKL